MTPSRRFVRLAFAIIGVGVPIVTLFAVAEARAIEGHARDIVENMLTSVRLVGRLESEVQRQQSLVEAHILAASPAERREIEENLAANDAAIVVTTRAYDPWATAPHERKTWEQTRADLNALSEPIVRALALSRENRDVEARQVMKAVAGRFTGVSQDLDQLISINDQEAQRNLGRVSAIRSRLTMILFGVGAFALAGTVLLGRWATRQVVRREEETALEARNLEERNRELDAFAGRVAHDIRGPLASIELAATQLAASAPDRSRPTEILRRGVQRLGRLVDDLLTLARVEGQVPGRCDPAAVAAEVSRDLGALVERERGKLRVTVDHATVSCSEGLLRQALTNLTENAVKYRRPDVTLEVDISGGAAGGGYDLRVSDNGVGIADDEAGRVFEPLYRSPRTRAAPGSGLGLSIVKSVVSASGGTVALQTRVGEGSTFVVHLPLAKASEIHEAEGRA